MSGRPKVAPKQVVPKRQLSRWERERRRRRILEIVISLVIIGVVVAGSVIAYGQFIKPWHQPIVKVNDKVFNMDYYVKMLRLYGAETYVSYYTSGYITLDDLGQYMASVADAIRDNELVRQGAEEFGITVSEESIEGKLWELLVAPDEELTDEDFQQRYQEILDKIRLSDRELKQMYIEPILLQSELLEYVEKETYAHVQVQAMLVAGADNATAVRDRWLAGENFNTLVADYSPSKYYPNTSSDNTTVEWIPQGIESAAFDEYAFAEGSENSTVSDAISESEGSDNYWLIKVLAKEDRTLSFNHWLEQKRVKGEEEGEIKSYLDGTKISWVLDHKEILASARIDE
ncbi:MAG TPA: SurA N-terminal domain-containing protein [Dehalococcoidia bacterium]|nr:SurA N-terminal domain-containing protein [Dehalococcoidia bacterium]